MIWFILIFVFLLVEAFTFNLITIWFAFGSMCSFISTYFTNDIFIQLVIFFSASFISLIFTKPLIDKYLKKDIQKTNFDVIIGKTAQVIKQIKPNESGRVHVLGKDWMAISNEDIEKGEFVEIIKIEGAKVIVRKKED